MSIGTDFIIQHVKHNVTSFIKCDTSPTRAQLSDIVEKYNCTFAEAERLFFAMFGKLHKFSHYDHTICITYNENEKALVYCWARAKEYLPKIDEDGEQEFNDDGVPLYTLGDIPDKKQGWEIAVGRAVRYRNDVDNVHIVPDDKLSESLQFIPRTVRKAIPNNVERAIRYFSNDKYPDKCKTIDKIFLYYDKECKLVEIPLEKIGKVCGNF